jgi:hypothetical protein
MIVVQATSASSLQKVAAVIAALVLVALSMALCYHGPHRLQQYCELHSEDAGEDTTDTIQLVTEPDKTKAEAAGIRYVSKADYPRYAEMFATFFDAARAPLSSKPTRYYFFEEVLFGVLTAVIGGVAPQSPSTCKATAYVLVAVAVLHLGYVTVLRPYDSKIDTVFSTLNALGVAAVGVIAAGRRGLHRDGRRHVLPDGALPGAARRDASLHSVEGSPLAEEGAGPRGQ